LDEPASIGSTSIGTGGAMTSMQANAVVATIEKPAGDRLARAARRLHEAELALHEARQTNVDQWISAAYDRLHEAASNYRFELARPDC
jgi:vacuolar-type H+-ATPase subunit E/Vma4